MPTLFLCLFRFFRLLVSGHQAVALENAALRLQLAAFRPNRRRPVLTTLDRMFWITLRRWWSGWRDPLLYVQADTSPAGSANGFAGFGPTCATLIAGDQAGPLRPCRFAN